jgi:5-methylcytosine-specific restriction endonuclease McrA
MGSPTPLGAGSCIASGTRQTASQFCRRSARGTRAIKLSRSALAPVTTRGIGATATNAANTTSAIGKSTPTSFAPASGIVIGRSASNPRAVLDYYKQWRARNLERARAYVRVAKHKRRAAAAGTHFTFEEWVALLAEHEGHCAYCGSTERIEADHRIPLNRGGSNEISNILPACRHCNRRKHRRTEEEFRALLQAERAAELLGSR